MNERMLDKRMPKLIKTVEIEGITKRGRPRMRWTDEVEEGLNIQ
jgi:hypothetical protein